MAVIDMHTSLNASYFTPFIVSALSFTVALNILTTSLIVLRLWSVSREIRPQITGRPYLGLVMRIIIESGLLYTLTAIITLGTGVLKNGADYIAAAALVQITGIAFNLIIIRCDQMLGDEPEARDVVQIKSNTVTVTTPVIPGSRPARVSVAPTLPILPSQTTWSSELHIESLPLGSHKERVRTM